MLSREKGKVLERNCIQESVPVELQSSPLISTNQTKNIQSLRSSTSIQLLKIPTRHMSNHLLPKTIFIRAG